MKIKFNKLFSDRKTCRELFNSSPEFFKEEFKNPNLRWQDLRNMAKSTPSQIIDFMNVIIKE